MAKKWGLGIEHELLMVAEKDDQFTISRSLKGLTPGGYGAQEPVFTSQGRAAKLYELQDGELKLTRITRDMSVENCLEIITTGWKNATVDRKVKGIIKTEKFLADKLRKPSYTERVYPFPFGARGPESTQSSVGSYHISITLPFEANHSSSESKRAERLKYKKRMKMFLKHLQWMEPLVMSMVGGPSPKSLGDAGDEPEGSLRSIRNSYGNLGGINPFEVVGKNSGYGKYHEGSTPPFRRLVRMKQPVTHSTKGEFMTRGRENASHGIGECIEIRFLDTFGARGLKDLTRLFVYLAANAEDRPYSEDNIAKADSDWNKAMARVIEEGFNSYLPEEYVKKLKKELNLKSIKLDTNGKVKGSLRAVDVMRKVEKELWKENKNKETSKLMIENNSQPLKVHNFNRDAWDFYLRRSLRLNSTLRKKLKEFALGLAEAEAEESGGWIKVLGKGDDGGIKDVIKNLLGEKYSAEDTRDLLDLLELHGLIELKRNEDGSIKEIKAKHGKAVMKKKLKAFIFNKKLFQTTEGLDPQSILRNYSVRKWRPGQEVVVKKNIPDEKLTSELQEIRDKRIKGEIIKMRRGYKSNPDDPLIEVKFPGIRHWVACPYNRLKIAKEALFEEEDEEPEIEIEEQLEPTPPEIAEIETPPVLEEEEQEFRFQPGTRVRHTRGRELTLGNVGTITSLDRERGQYLIRTAEGRYTRWAESSVEAIDEKTIRALQQQARARKYKDHKGPGWYSTRPDGTVDPQEVRRHQIAGKKAALARGDKLRKKKKKTRKIGDFEL